MEKEGRKRRGFGEGGIYYRPERDQYTAQVSLGIVSGKRVRRAVVGKTKAEVLAKMAELQDQARKGQITTGPNQTVGQWLDTWHTGLSTTGKLKASTIRNYQEIIDHWITEDVKRVKLANLTAEHVDKMVRDLAAAGKSTNTQRLARTVLRRAIGQAERRGYVNKNVVALTDGVAVQVKENVPLTSEQAKAVLDHVGKDSPQWLAFYTLTLHNGLREGELIALKWSNVDLDAGLVTITSTFDPKARTITDPKSGSSKRTIALTAEGIEALKVHQMEQALTGHQAEGLVFTGRTGKALYASRVRQHWAKVQTALGIGPIRFHDLRHSCATILLAKGVPIEMVSKVLGHASIRITADVYNYIPPEATREAADTMSEALR